MRSEPRGVRGWLLLLCLGLTVFGPVRWLAEMLLSPQERQPWYDDLTLALYLNSLVGVGLLVFGMTAGVFLWRVRPGAVLLAKVFLSVQAIYALVWLALSFRLELPGATLEELVLLRFGISSLAFFAVWFTYLHRSRRVNNTYDVSSSATARSLASYRDLGAVVRGAGTWLPVWVAVAYAAGAWLSQLLFLLFYRMGGFPGAHVFPTTSVVAGLVLGVLFAFFLARDWVPWQQGLGLVLWIISSVTYSGFRQLA